EELFGEPGVIHGQGLRAREVPDLDVSKSDEGRDEVADRERTRIAEHDDVFFGDGPRAKMFAESADLLRPLAIVDRAAGLDEVVAHLGKQKQLVEQEQSDREENGEKEEFGFNKVHAVLGLSSVVGHQLSVKPALRVRSGRPADD